MGHATPDRDMLKLRYAFINCRVGSFNFFCCLTTLPAPDPAQAVSRLNLCVSIHDCTGCRRVIDKVVREEGVGATAESSPKTWDGVLKQGSRDVVVGCCYLQCGDLAKDREQLVRVQVCARCMRALYCSADCQKAAWIAGHAAVCKNAGGDVSTRK